MSNLHAILIVAICALVTMALRFLPFLIFGPNRKTPAFITYLGKHLPCAIMAMLVVYCLKDVTPPAAPHGIPEAIAVLVVVVLHVWRRSTLLSIVAGTVSYMLLIQFVF